MNLSDANLLELHSGDYVRKYEKKPISRLRRLKKHFDLGSEKKIVDYACGNAMLLEVLDGNFKEYHGVDFSEDMLIAAKKRSGRMTFCPSMFFYRENIFDFAAKNYDQFDLAFALDFSEHVADDEWIKILLAIRSSLKSGGVLYLHTPNLEYFIEFFKHKGILQQYPEHIAVRTLDHNLRLLKEAGFSSCEAKFLAHYEWRQKPFGLLGHFPWIGRYFKARIFISAVK